MKITNKRNTSETGKDASTKRTNKAGSGILSLFSTELISKNKSIQNQHELDISQLKTELDIAGDKLEIDPTITNFRNFRNILSSLAKNITSDAYRLEKIGGTPMNPRYFEIITIIDKEADKLYELIVKEQKNRMAITESVIGIKGLVVDLMT